jgi:hypothetical protein
MSGSGSSTAACAAHHGVEQPVFERLHPVQEADLEREQASTQQQRAPGCGLIGRPWSHASVCRSSTLASISSRLMDTLSTFTPSWHLAGVTAVEDTPQVVAADLD